MSDYCPMISQVLAGLGFLQDATFWIGFGSVATAALALLTNSSLRQYARKEKEVEAREIIEKIVQPVLQDAEQLIAGPLQDFFVSQPRWVAIKQENPFVVYRVPKKIIKAIDDLFSAIDMIQLRYHLNDTLRSICASHIVEQLRNRPANYDANFANHASYSWRVRNGKTYYFTFASFLCAGTTLHEEIEASKGGNQNATIENEWFNAGGRQWAEVSRDVFEEILARVRGDVTRNHELTEYIDMYRDLRPRVQALKAELEAFQRQILA